jgi:soluble lytic murein transglycosylase-like protein
MAQADVDALLAEPIKTVTLPEGTFGGATHISVPGPIEVPGGEAPGPAKPPPPAKVIRRAGGAEDLGAVYKGIELTESGGKPDAASPKGAKFGYGLMGVSEAAAADLKYTPEDLRDPETNRVVGKEYYNRQFAKYGNHDDALAAYNIGPAKVDDWIKAGRPNNDVGKAASKYINQVMEKADLDSPGRRLANNRGKGTFEDLEALGGKFQYPTNAPEDDESVLDVAKPFDIPGTAFLQPIEKQKADIEADPIAAFAQGFGREMLAIPAGIAQAVGEQLSPTMAAKITEQMNAFDEKMTPFSENHPYMYFAGRMTGGTIGILSGAKLIAPATTWAASKLPWLAQFGTTTAGEIAGAVGSGAAIGATAFNPNGEPADRVWEAPIGGLLGGLGLGVGRGLAWTIRNIADQTAQNAFIQQLRDVVGHLGPNVSAVRDIVTQQMEAASKKLEDLYTVRDEAGQAVKGFSAPELGAALKAAEAKATDPAAPAVARQARNLMGLTAEDARRAAWEKDMARWEKQMKKWRKDIDSKISPHAGPTLRAAVERGFPPPTGPAAFVPAPVSAVQYARGINYLAGQGGRDAQQMAKALHTEAGTQARAVRRVGKNGKLLPGTPLVDFLRALKRADDFHDGQVAPLQKAFEKRFRFQRKGEVPGTDITNADFYEWVTSVVEHGDKAEIEGLSRIMGSSDRLRSALQNDILHKMLMDAGPNKGKAKFEGKLIGEYIVQHRAGLQAVLSRERFAELEGQAKIAERIAEYPRLSKAAQHGSRLFGYSGFLTIMGLEHAVRGNVQEGAIMAASGFFAHTIFNLLSRVAQLRTLTPIVQRAGTLPPGSPALDEAISKLMMSLQLRYPAAGRVVSEEAIGGEN